VQALARFRWLVPAIGIPVLLAAAALALDAAAFGRPPRPVVLATRALSQLAEFRVMRGLEVIGSRPLRSTCVQGWFRRHGRVARGALVVLGDGTRLYDFGHGVRAFDGSGAADAERRRFLLAGCPRLLDERLGSRLVRGIAVEATPALVDGIPAYRVQVGRSSALDVYVARSTLRPVELRLPGAGWSDLEPGGGRTAIVRVRRAFRLARPRGRHA
jgi:hypothetical protein